MLLALFGWSIVKSIYSQLNRFFSKAIFNVSRRALVDFSLYRITEVVQKSNILECVNEY